MTSIFYILMVGLLGTWHHHLFTFLQVHFFPSMWAYGHHFHIENADDGHLTQDYGVEVDFDQSKHASHHDRNLIGGKLCYFGKMREIIQVDISSFQCVIFRFKWWDTFDKNNVKEDRDSRLIESTLERCGMKVRSLMFSQNIGTKCSFTQMCWIEIGASY